MFLFRLWRHPEDDSLEEANLSTIAWEIGQAIENGENEEEARHRALSHVPGEIVVSTGASVATGGVVAAATGLGGVGLAFGGGAVGIGAATAVAGPAVAAGALGYGAYRLAQDFSARSRVAHLRNLVDYFRNAGQTEKADKVLYLEGRAQIERHHDKMRNQSADAMYGFLRTSTSEALVGLFGSQQGEFILTFDLNAQQWCYVRFINGHTFDGKGMDLRGQEFGFEGLGSVDNVLRILAREGYVELASCNDEDSHS